MSNYIDKEGFYNEIIEWQDACKAAEAAGVEPPRMTDSIGRKIIEMAYGMGGRWNFNKYSWVDEMIGDGIEAATKAIPKFDRDHPKKNPFGFLNFVIWRAFVTRLKEENAEIAARMEMMLDETVEMFDQAEGDDFQLSKSDMIDVYSRNS